MTAHTPPRNFNLDPTPTATQIQYVRDLDACGILSRDIGSGRICLAKGPGTVFVKHYTNKELFDGINKIFTYADTHQLPHDLYAAQPAPTPTAKTAPVAPAATAPSTVTSTIAPASPATASQVTITAPEAKPAANPASAPTPKSTTPVAAPAAKIAPQTPAIKLSRIEAEAYLGKVIPAIIKLESSGDAKASNPNSSAVGIGQYRAAPWIYALGAYGDSVLKAHANDKDFAPLKEAMDLISKNKFVVITKGKNKGSWSIFDRKTGANVTANIPDDKFNALFDLRENTKVATAILDQETRQNFHLLSKSLGHVPDGQTLYLAHALGLEQARTIAQLHEAAPDAAMSQPYLDAAIEAPPQRHMDAKVKEVIKGNPGIFGKTGEQTVGQFYAAYASKVPNVETFAKAANAQAHAAKTAAAHYRQVGAYNVHTKVKVAFSTSNIGARPNIHYRGQVNFG
jgi:hypothetical protein